MEKITIINRLTNNHKGTRHYNINGLLYRTRSNKHESSSVCACVWERREERERVRELEIYI